MTKNYALYINIFYAAGKKHTKNFINILFYFWNYIYPGFFNASERIQYGACGGG